MKQQILKAMSAIDLLDESGLLLSQDVWEQLNDALVAAVEKFLDIDLSPWADDDGRFTAWDTLKQMVEDAEDDA